MARSELKEEKTMEDKKEAEEIYREPVYTIGHAAEKLGVSVPTLRMYEHAGLVLPFRTKKNRRLYSRHDIRHLQVIIDLIRRNRLNLEGIKRLAASLPCWIITECPEDRYKFCEAYTDCDNPCWMIPEKKCIKSQSNCRTCKVYLSCPKNLKDLKSLHRN